MALVFLCRDAKAGVPDPPRIIAVSKSAKKDIGRDFNIPANKFSIVPNGINTDLFYPIDDIERKKNRIIVTNSADTL